MIRDTKLLWQTTRKLFSTLKSATENSCARNHLTAGHRNFCWMDDVCYGRCAKPCWAYEHLRDDDRNTLSNKAKEHGFSQDERHTSLFMNEKLDVCVGVHVDDMQAVGPSELTKTLSQKLAKNMAMRWCMVTETPQELLGRCLSKTTQGYISGVSCGYAEQLCKDLFFGEPTGSKTLAFEKILDSDAVLDAGQRRHRPLLVRILWLDRPDIRMQSVNCPLPSELRPLVMKAASAC